VIPSALAAVVVVGPVTAPVAGAAEDTVRSCRSRVFAGAGDSAREQYRKA
jgi:hypothetical protein